MKAQEGRHCGNTQRSSTLMMRTRCSTPARTTRSRLRRTSRHSFWSRECLLKALGPRSNQAAVVAIPGLNLIYDLMTQAKCRRRILRIAVSRGARRGRNSLRVRNRATMKTDSFQMKAQDHQLPDLKMCISQPFQCSSTPMTEASRKHKKCSIDIWKKKA